MIGQVGVAAVLGLLQGFGLYIVEMRGNAWTAIDLALFAALVFGPTVVQLSWHRLRRREFWLLAALLTAVLAGMGAYAGWSVAGLPGSMGVENILPPFWFSAAFVVLVALPAVQAGGPVSYAEWFRGTTRAALLVLQAALFAGTGWMLLLLSAGLFDAIGIHVVERLLGEDYVTWPLLWMLAGVGAQALLPDALDWMRRQILLVLSWLQPIAAVIAIAFLCALLFTGLQPLWDTRSATALLLGLAAILVLLIAATVQTGERAAELPRWRIAVIAACALALPVYAALAGYALGLRIAQHGWSVDRAWAALVAGAVGLLAFGYLAALAMRPRAGVQRFGTVNLAVLAIVAGMLALMHSPMLDPKEIAARSQVARLLAGKDTPALFDYGYLRFHLGRPGERALRELSAVEGHKDAEAIRGCSAEALALQQTVWDWRCRGPALTVPEARTRFVVYPAGSELDEDLIRRLIEASGAPLVNDTGCLRTRAPCSILRVDLNGDGLAEYVLMSNATYGRVFSRLNGRWEEIGFVTGPRGSYAEQPSTGALARGPIEPVDKQWNDLRIGSQTYELHRNFSLPD